ncbi:hypothetical protein ACFLV7_09740 [Chloroflexota bacterium]
MNDSLQETVDSIQLQQTGIAHTVAAYTQSAQETNHNQSLPTEATTQVVLPTASSLQQAVSGNNDAQSEGVDSRDLDLMLKSSKILLFEDMSGSRQIRYVKKALDEAGYYYLDVGSAKGWFKNQLLSQEDWDLIIVAAEARRDFGGEYFEYVHEKIKQGSGAIIEFWNIDDAPLGKIKPLLDDCGVKFQSDWYEPDLRSLFWLQNDHPILNEPNEMSSKLREAASLWRGDIGDMLEIESTNSQRAGDAVLIAGTNGLWKTDHGALAICLDGRVIIQTFSSHEYSMDDMVQLWQNYFYSSLKSHYALTSSSQHTQVPTAEPEMNPSGTESAPAPIEDPAYGVGFEFKCGSIFTARVPELPIFVKDMFEHHADGTYLIVDLELIKELGQTVQIWDGDYYIEGQKNGELVLYSPDKAATGYLYIQNPVNLSQDRIEPGGMWRTKLAFDVDPLGEDWVLVVKPGSEIGRELCEVRIPLTR